MNTSPRVNAPMRSASKLAEQRGDCSLPLDSGLAFAAAGFIASTKQRPLYDLHLKNKSHRLVVTPVCYSYFYGVGLLIQLWISYIIHMYMYDSVV